MNIKSLYIIQLEDGTKINSGETIRVKVDSSVYDLESYLENGYFKGTLSSCDDEGVWVSIGPEVVDSFYFYFKEIEELEEIKKYSEWLPVFEEINDVKVLDDDGGRQIYREGKTDTLMNRREAWNYFLHNTISGIVK